VFGIAPTHGQDLALGLVELHAVKMAYLKSRIFGGKHRCQVGQMLTLCIQLRGFVNKLGSGCSAPTRARGEIVNLA